MSGEQLERRYRSLLRTLPKPYREARGEELLSVLMDGAAEGRRWPETREVLSLAWLGLRVRARGTGAGAEGSRLERTRLGEMSRLVGILGSVLMAYVGVLQLVLFVREFRTIPGHTFGQILNPFAAGDGSAVRRLGVSAAQFEVPACWLVVLGLLAMGWWRAARVLAVAVFLLSTYLAADMRMAMYEEAVLAAVTTAALFAVRGPAARPVRVPGFAAVAALIGVMGFEYWRGAELPVRVLFVLRGRGYTDSGHAMAAVAVVVAVVCVLAYRSVVWPVALAVVAVAALVGALAEEALLPFVVFPDMTPLVSLMGALVVVAGLAVLKDRLSRRSASGGGVTAG